MTKKKIIHNAVDYGVSKERIDADALKVIEILQDHGFDAYIVGGGIRDLLLNKTPKDFDVVTNASPETVAKIFIRNSCIIGRRFKLVHVIFRHKNEEKSERYQRSIHEKRIIEVSTYRNNKIHQEDISERGRVLIDNNYGTQKEDVSRRDFTMNAMYYDPIKEIICDYYNGMDDIADKIIRIIGHPLKRYTEDPVRIIRAIRLSVKLELTIDEKTSGYFDKLKHLLIHEPRGRMFEEMLKILVSGYAEQCLNQINAMQIPKHIFPLFDRLFFNDNVASLALAVIRKTDERMRNAEDVSTVFVLSGLFWIMINDKWCSLIQQKMHFRQALLEAIARQKGYIYSIGVTKILYNTMRDIWLLQLDIERPSVGKIDSIVNQVKFRQAWHLFTLRNQFNQVNPKIFQWWNSYINAALHEEKQELLTELATLLHELYPRKKKRRR